MNNKEKDNSFKRGKMETAQPALVLGVSPKPILSSTPSNLESSIPNNKNDIQTSESATKKGKKTIALVLIFMLLSVAVLVSIFVFDIFGLM